MNLIKDLVGFFLIWGALLVVITALWLSAPTIFYWVLALGLTFLIFAPFGR